MIALAAAGQLQTVQRALAGQRLIQVPLAAQQPQQRIRAQLLMIVQVFIAQRQTIDALRKHLRQAVLDQQRCTAIDETARQPAQKVDPAICLPQQKCSAVTRYSPGCELRLLLDVKNGL